MLALAKMKCDILTVQHFLNGTAEQVLFRGSTFFPISCVSGIMIISVEKSISNMKQFFKKILMWLYNPEQVKLQCIIILNFDREGRRVYIHHASKKAWWKKAKLKLICFSTIDLIANKSYFPLPLFLGGFFPDILKLRSSYSFLCF